MDGSSFLNTAFDLVFPGLVAGENTVLCPFHAERTPSCQINTISKVYHCFGCGAHGNENDFIEKYFGVSKSGLAEFKSQLYKSELLEDFEHFNVVPEVNNNYTYLELIKLGANPAVLAALKVGVETEILPSVGDCPSTIAPIALSTRLVFPIIVRNRIFDKRAYTMCPADRPPKTKSVSGAIAGLILPYHLWCDDAAPTIICEGEKDMLFARSHGFNAISIGGCNNIPTTFLDSFTGRKVYIVYDNDVAGRAGATKLASSLFEVTKQLYICDIGAYVKNDKEDVTDFFTTYHLGRKEFDEMLAKSKLFDTTAQEVYIRDSFPKVTLNEASTTHLGKTVRSNIQVMATYEDQYSVPSYASFVKMKTGSKNEANNVNKGESASWLLTKSNFDDILILTDNNLRKDQIYDNLKTLIGWGGEEYVKVTTTNPKTIFKSQVADNTESVGGEDIKRTEFLCYSDVKLEAGKNYQLIYRIVPHAYRGQQQVLLATSVKESSDTITSFEVTANTVEQLKAFQGKSFKDLVLSQKSYIKFNVDTRLLEFIDLWYHTPPLFKFGNFTGIRGYLDGLIVAESRVGKSSTSKALSEIYEVGAIASLAGSAATPAGLIGGSVKAGNSSQIRPGLIPRNHGRSIIFEELAKAKYSLLSELTDIRSSGVVRINRATGDLTLPASVRILFLSNPKATEDGPSRPIIAYPNGLEIVKDLVGATEDVSRFDFIYILGAEPGRFDATWTAPPGFTHQQLKTRIRWVWSRKESQIIIPKSVEDLIITISEEFNNDYMNSTKIFSTETWKKLARLSIAIAGYMVSTGLTYEDIIVTETHVKLAAVLLKSIYDNNIFKLKEYTLEERKKLCTTAQDLTTLKDLKTKFPAIIQYLENNSFASKSILFTISGTDQMLFNTVMKALSENYFVEMSKEKVYPTPKLLMTARKLDEGSI